MAKKTSTKSAKKETAISVVPEERQEVSQPTPQQALFLEYYYDHHSPTWGNAKQSAIRAGYTEEFACTITYKMPKWWSEFVRQNSLIDKIEKHFQEVLSMPNITPAMGAFGPIEKKETVIQETGEVYKSGKRKGQPKTRRVTIKTPVYVPNIPLIKAKNEAAKIAAPAHDPERYGKKPGGNKFIFNMAPERQRFAT